MNLRPITLLTSIVLAACATPEPVDTDTDIEDTGPIVQDDQDEDTILDVHEGSGDMDEDGLPNLMDKDSDGDNVRDKVEAVTKT